ncbi:hypothetical protein E5CHR_01540 [Variovorax sp. PBL-E5]|nr:hypothetical protein E5CHR_01540 [Variovorax sp. PBL-E5]
MCIESTEPRVESLRQMLVVAMFLKSHRVNLHKRYDYP